VSADARRLLAGYYFVPKWRVNVVGGMPSDYNIDSPATSTVSASKPKVWLIAGAAASTRSIKSWTA